MAPIESSARDMIIGGASCILMYEYLHKTSKRYHNCSKKARNAKEILAIYLILVGVEDSKGLADSSLPIVCRELNHQMDVISNRKEKRPDATLSVFVLGSRRYLVATRDSKDSPFYTSYFRHQGHLDIYKQTQTVLATGQLHLPLELPPT